MSIFLSHLLRKLCVHNVNAVVWNSHPRLKSSLISASIYLSSSNVEPQSIFHNLCNVELLILLTFCTNKYQTMSVTANSGTWRHEMIIVSAELYSKLQGRLFGILPRYLRGLSKYEPLWLEADFNSEMRIKNAHALIQKRNTSSYGRLRVCYNHSQGRSSSTNIE